MSTYRAGTPIVNQRLRENSWPVSLPAGVERCYQTKNIPVELLYALSTLRGTYICPRRPH
jgi:hypothetical protein